MTVVLVMLGGTVTSKGVGLAVPDWPTTFGYNMFGVPLGVWVGRGGVFWEHSHRLVGSLVGVATIVMVLLLWLRRMNRAVPYVLRIRRPFVVRDPVGAMVAEPTGLVGLRWMGVAVLGMVMVQGIMGGLRVTQISTTLAIAHGIFAQVILCVTVVMARAIRRTIPREPIAGDAVGGSGATLRFSQPTRRLSVVLLVVMFIQLILGAVTRHTGSGLAIPDFPSVYGGWLPPIGGSALQEATGRIPYERLDQAYAPGQVYVHYTHRVWAIVVAGLAIWTLTRIGGESREKSLECPRFWPLVACLVSQLMLGALVIWTGRQPEVATAHQTIGAVLLVTTVLLTVRVHEAASMMPRQEPDGRVSPADALAWQSQGASA
jgi:cytochrome c oxidase assembly protein subunit 15